MTLLSVNLNKIAVLRNARGESEPDIAHAAETCIGAGCGGITVHPRPDRRHVTPDDVILLAELVRGRVEYNLEGNPFAPPREGYPGFIELVRRARPTQATLVPDAEGQITSDHGFDLAAARAVGFHQREQRRDGLRDVLGADRERGRRRFRQEAVRQAIQASRAP